MTVEVVTDAAALAALREDWEHLEERIGHPPYYARHHFVSAWWGSYSADRDFELAVLTIRHNGILVGVAPLAVHRSRTRGTTTRLVRWATHGDYMAFVVDPAVRAERVCRELLDHAEQHLDSDRLNLGNVPSDSELSAYLLKSDRHNPLFTLHVENPHLNLTKYADFADYRGRQIPSKASKKRNKMLRALDPTFRVYRGDEGNIFARMHQLHRQEKDFLVEQQQRTDRYSLFENKFRVNHYRPLYEAGRTLTFAYEDSETRLLGYKSCFVDGRRLLTWNTAYAPEIRDLRPITVLLWDIVEHLLEGERDFDVLDFGAGRYPWKFAWTDEFTTTYRLRIKPLPEPVKTEDSVNRSDQPQAERSKSEPSPPKLPAPPQPPVDTVTYSVAPDPSVSTRRRLARAARTVARGVRSAVRRRTNPPVIWYVPHPDDETIFMGGSIHRMRDRRSIVVLLTRGGASNALAKVDAKLDGPLGVPEFMAGRLREMSAAMVAIGVRERDVVRHDLTDGSIEEDAVHAVITDLARAHPMAQHRTMSYLDPHRDHAVAGAALRRAHREGLVTDAVFHLPVPLVSADLGKRAPLSKADVAAKRAALREYQVWDPMRGRYAIGATSVASLVRDQLANPDERVHGPDFC